MCMRKLPRINYPHLSAGLALCLCLSAAAPVQSVELEQLWLPKSYLRHLPRLYDAARLVEESPGCEELLEGTSHLGRSALEHPVFTLKCRNPAGRTFSLMVDGPSLMKVDDTRPGGLVSFEQLREEYELAQQRERERQEKARELAALEAQKQQTEQERQQWLQWWEDEFARRETFWKECVAALEQRVGGMQALEWLTTERPEPELGQAPNLESHPPLTYVIDFNAESYYGEALFYRASCRQDDQGELELDIKARRD